MSSKGRRTGVTVAGHVARNRTDNMEDAEALFDAAKSPETQDDKESSNSKNNNNQQQQKPKEKVRFSLAENIVDQLDTTVSSQHPVRRLVKQGDDSKNRASMDTNELSSVSTAAPSVLEAPNEDSHQQQQQQNADEDDPDRDPGDRLTPPPPDSSESESEGAAAAAGGQEEDDAEIVAAQRQEQGDEEDDFPVADNENPDDDNDFPVGGDNFDDEEEDAPPAAETQDDDGFPDADGGGSDEDDKEGTGFDMSGGRGIGEDKNNDDEDGSDDEELETPEAVREKRRRKAERAEKLAAAKKKREAASVKSKKKKAKKKVVAPESSDDEDDDSEATPVVKKKPAAKKKKFNPYATTFESKGQPLPLTYTAIPMSEKTQATPNDSNVRRSKRARVAPLEFWRNEKYEWGANDFDEEEFDGVTNMPVPIKIIKANPTPYKKRKVSAVPKKKKGGKKGDKELAVAAEEETFDASKLKHAINDGNKAQLWDERYNDTRGIKVVSYHASMEARDLPLSKTRKKSEGKVVGKAAQSFHMSNEENPSFPGYIVGSLVLPPKGIKDAESVGLCAQVFTVVRGQPGSIEIAYGDPDNGSAVWEPATAERFMLSQGDNFLVPPGNTYRIQNHSKTTEALLSWTIIRHNSALAEQSP